MQFDVQKVINKLKSALNVDKDIELANAMGVKVRTFASWKSRNTFDFLILFDFCEKKSISLDWLFELTTKNEIREPEVEYEISKVDNIESRLKILESKVSELIKE